MTRPMMAEEAKLAGEVAILVEHTGFSVGPMVARLGKAHLPGMLRGPATVDLNTDDGWTYQVEIVVRRKPR